MFALTVRDATLLAKSLGSGGTASDSASLESRSIGIGSAGVDSTAGEGTSGVDGIELTSDFLLGVARMGNRGSKDGSKRQ
jgi:hypothetical protein